MKKRPSCEPLFTRLLMEIAITCLHCTALQIGALLSGPCDKHCDSAGLQTQQLGSITYFRPQSLLTNQIHSRQLFSIPTLTRALICIQYLMCSLFARILDVPVPKRFRIEGIDYNVLLYGLDREQAGLLRRQRFRDSPHQPYKLLCGELGCCTTHKHS